MALLCLQGTAAPIDSGCLSHFALVVDLVDVVQFLALAFLGMGYRTPVEYSSSSSFVHWCHQDDTESLLLLLLLLLLYIPFLRQNRLFAIELDWISEGWN